MKMKQLISPLILVVLVLIPALAQNPAPVATASESKALAGEYMFSTGYVGAEYKLREDGSFEYVTFSDCCDPVWREAGTFAVRDQLLHFKITRKSLNEYNLLDSKSANEGYRKIYKYEEAELPAKVMRKEYDLQIVRWGERIYLVDLENLPLFTAAVNFAIEPRRHLITDLTVWSFLRRGDEAKAVAGKPALPEPWKSFLHDSPIKATITRIDLQDGEKIYRVNKGSADGIQAGMYLAGENTRPERTDLLLVTAVEESSAALKSTAAYGGPSYEPGTVLVTKLMKTSR